MAHSPLVAAVFCAKNQTCSVTGSEPTSLETACRIFFLNSPRRDFAKKIACRPCNVFGFRHAAVDERASSARPNFLHDQRAGFTHDSAKVLNRRSGSGFADEFRRTF